MDDREILRSLAGRYAEAAVSDDNLRHILMHRQVNDLVRTRPIVLIEELPWEELDGEGELTIRCKDPDCRDIEAFFRTNLYKWTHMRADMVLIPYVPIHKVFSVSDYGIIWQAEKRAEGVPENAQTVKFVNQIQEPEDLAKLHNVKVTYDAKASVERAEKISAMIGDLVPVRLTGENTGYWLGCKTWDDIAQICGVDNLLIDLVDRPELMHGLVSKLTDIFLDMMYQFEELNLLNGDAYEMNCASSLNHVLHPDPRHVKLDQVWGRGLAQILSSVSPAMHDEFDIQYMKRAMAPFGLVYYGCCEALDRKIDILRQIPHLRKISISPWADVDVAADAIAGDYVIAAKPNPAFVATDSLDEEVIRGEIRRIVEACRRNHTNCDIILKDITTVNHRPQNLWRWQEIALEEACRYE
ncbi:MAG TPA: hypothetical protein H9694_03175 [Firmicutes bacterium]|nr:hypothetical protein [Bacillota bacterium]